MRSFFKSFFTIFSGTILSKIFGFVRDILIANFVGSSFYSDIFFTAFKIPNFFRQIFAEGAMSNAFTPIFSNGLIKYGKNEMKNFARNIFSILFLSLFIVVFIFELFMPYFIRILAPGYVQDINKFKMVVFFTRITFPYVIFISIASFYGSILNSFEKFFAFSFFPVVLNVILICFLLFFKNYEIYEYLKMISYGILLAGFGQFLWVIFFSIKENFFLFPKIIEFTSMTKIFFRNFFNSLLSSGIYQINALIDSIIASSIPNAVSLLYYADRIYNFPLSLIGTALGIATLPTLSKYIDSEKEKSQEIQETTFFVAMFLGIPASFGILTLSYPITKMFFERGNFLPENTASVSILLKIYSIGLPFFILNKICKNIFYAIKDTQTPMLYSLKCLIINFILNIIFSHFIGINGIVLSSIISSIYSTLSLFIILIKKNIFNLTNNIIVSFLKILYSSIIMSIFAFSSYKLLIKYNIFLNMLFSVGFAVLIFIFLSIFINIINLQDIKSIFKRKKNY